MTVVKVLNRFIIHIGKMFCIYISVGNFPECVVLNKEGTDRIHFEASCEKWKF